MSQLCHNLATLRDKASITQSQVATALGTTTQTVSNWETGIRVMRLTPNQMVILCKLLQCSVEELSSYDRIV